jgi:hypothetical protein
LATKYGPWRFFWRQHFIYQKLLRTAVDQPDEKEGFIEIILFLILASKMALQTFPFAYLMSYPSIT